MVISLSSWERFVLNGEHDPQMRNVILDSWDRCKALGVSYDLEEVFSHSTEHELKKRKELNQYLIHAATPVMLDLYNQLKGGGYVILLADPEGYLIEMMADPIAQSIADRGGMSPGARWMEENVGSTGLSIALRTRIPMVTSGYEHFCKALRTWDCSACPIFIEDQFMGVFDVCRVGPGNDVKELYTIAVAGAKAIRDRIRYEKLQFKEKILTQTLMEYTNLKQGTGIITFDAWGQIVHRDKNADHFIHLLDEENQIINRSNDIIKPLILERLKEHSNQMGTILLEGCKFALHSKEIFHKEQQIGTVIFIEKEPKDLYFPMHPKDKSPVYSAFQTKSPKLLKQLKLAVKVANTDASILIQGESGSGKDFLTRAIHEESKRRNKPFVAINCASLPKDLIASELFGYAPGAFTGAKQKGNVGKIETANGGTLFLDEIGDMPLDLQAVLLRTLEEKHIVRIGSSEPIPVDVRIIAATHKDVNMLIQQGKFREDLYYRLSVFQIYLPPLRERTEDLDDLLEKMITSSCQKANRRVIQFTSDAIQSFKHYSWPGNLRELRNIVERITYLHEGDTFDSEHVKDFVAMVEDKTILIEDEENYILSILEQTKGNRAEAARQLGISRGALYRKMEKYRII